MGLRHPVSIMWHPNTYMSIYHLFVWHVNTYMCIHYWLCDMWIHTCVLSFYFATCKYIDVYLPFTVWHVNTYMRMYHVTVRHVNTYMCTYHFIVRHVNTSMCIYHFFVWHKYIHVYSLAIMWHLATSYVITKYIHVYLLTHSTNEKPNSSLISCGQKDRLNHRSLLQNIVSFIGLFCLRDV